MRLYPHRIRLRGPWECEALAAGQAAPRRLTMPCHWRETQLKSYRGPLRLRRRFGYPGQIDEYERVWITFAGDWHATAVLVNGSPLGSMTGSGEFDVTTLLRERNEVAVDLAIDDATPDWGEVALEVRCAAHLSEVRVTARPTGAAVTLEASGRVVGTADVPLELYVVVDRSNAAYAIAQPGPFRLVANELSRATWQDRPAEDGPLPIVRVDLIHGASIWYRWEQAMPLSGENS